MEVRKQLHAIARSNHARTLRDQESMSLRRRRKNVPFGEGFLARFSGRQNDAFSKALSPAKAGLITNPLAYPGFRSLRSLHPGLFKSPPLAGLEQYDQQPSFPSNIAVSESVSAKHI